MSLHPMQERVSAGPAIGVALLVISVTTLILGLILFQFLPPSGWYHDHPFPAPISWFAPYFLDQIHANWANSWDANIIARLSWFPRVVWTESVEAFDLADAYGERLLALLIIALMAGIGAGVRFYGVSEPRDSLIHITGRRLWRGYPAIKTLRRILAPAIALSGCGIKLAPGIALDRSREVQHFGLVGTTGAGKSTVLRFMIDQIQTRGDKLLIHDTKGDMLAGLPADKFILLAPHDRRSHAWDAARDIVTTQDARELAARLIPESHDPTWSSAARDILAGIVISLQRGKPLKWSWQDLADTAFLPVAELSDTLLNAYPAASRYIELSAEGTPTRTTHGILVTLWAAAVGIILPLAAAWGSVSHSRRLSLCEWITDDSGKLPNILVLQRSPSHPALSAAWIGSAVDSISSIVASASLADSESRRIWLLLDEFAQLGKLNSFRQALELGRSKGVACVLALQDVQQLTALYGDAVAKTILTLLGIKIIGKLPAGPSAATITGDIIGQREVAWRETVISMSEGKTNRTYQTNRATIPVVTPDQLESRLGVDQHGVRALLIGFGDVFELRWPLLFWTKRRPATEQADWVSR